jgi:hypothetical protein
MATEKSGPEGGGDYLIAPVCHAGLVSTRFPPH